MRDLLRLSDDELAEMTTPQRLRVIGACGISAACGIISLRGMAAFFTDARIVPLPGMHELSGQIAWGSVLVVLLIVVTFLVRGVVKRRLQWAIALSLLIHFLLCASMSAVEFRGPRPSPTPGVEFPDARREEFTLPDYADSESAEADSPWRQPSDSQTPEVPTDLERSQMELADAQKPEPILAEEQTGTYRLIGLSALEREADLREVLKAVPEVALVRLDAAKAEVTLRFDPEKLFPPTKSKQQPAPDKITERVNSLIGQASKNTFSLTAPSTVPTDKLTKVEIPIGVLDCKGCRYAAYQAVAKLDGVERATVSATPSAVIAWIDATRTKREALEDALKKARVELILATDLK